LLSVPSLKTCCCFWSIGASCSARDSVRVLFFPGADFIRHLFRVCDICCHRDVSRSKSTASPRSAGRNTTHKPGTMSGRNCYSYLRKSLTKYRFPLPIPRIRPSEVAIITNSSLIQSLDSSILCHSLRANISYKLNIFLLSRINIYHQVDSNWPHEALQSNARKLHDSRKVRLAAQRFF
jgi:hypothetical protein